MNQLSLKEVAASVLHKTGNLEARNDIFNIPNLPSARSLRSNLRFLDSIYRFAPEVRLHPGDPNRPSSVGWYLQTVRMRRHRQWWPDEHILDRGDVTVSRLISQSSGGEHSGRGRDGTQFFLQIASNDSLIRKGSLQSAECYVHFRHAPQRNGQIDIQYWFFYPYNSFGPGHEGDWEHITVRVTNNFNIRRIFFASHARESEWHRPTGFHLNNAGHPIVYSAIGSHACYWFAGKRDRGKFHTAEIPPDDFTANGGPVWKTWENLRIIGEFDNPLSNQEWIKYTGHWGEIGTAGTSELLVTSGPYGPAFQAWWDDDDEGNKSL